MEFGTCLRCGCPPDQCDCFTYFAETGKPASVLAPGVLLFITNARPENRGDDFSRGLVVRVQVEESATFDDLQQSTRSVFAWRNAITEWRGYSIGASSVWELSVFQLHRMLQSYPQAAETLNLLVSRDLSAHTREDVQPTQSEIEEMEPSEGGSSDFYVAVAHNEWFLHDARQLLRLVWRPDDDVAIKPRAGRPRRYVDSADLDARIEALIDEGLSAIRAGKPWATAEYPITRDMVALFVRRVKERRKRNKAAV